MLTICTKIGYAMKTKKPKLVILKGNKFTSFWYQFYYSKWNKTSLVRLLIWFINQLSWFFFFFFFFFLSHSETSCEQVLNLFTKHQKVTTILKSKIKTPNTKAGTSLLSLHFTTELLHALFMWVHQVVHYLIFKFLGVWILLLKKTALLISKDQYLVSTEISH